ncbi:MAG TPA: phosphoribosylamine--glycine ligase [Armatimonadetes bacterium]|nr:phosphoribosylamine--glycine ligase [Armatimonadota bacterium]
MSRALIVGSGGREHALAWKLAQECEVHAIPGNPGVAEVAECHEGSAEDLDAVLETVSRLQPDLVVVGPENPLIAGLADRLRQAGVPCFGPGAREANLEGSKAFAKELMTEAGVPTALGRACSTPQEAMEAVRELAELGKLPVIKASGAALGKGVIVCDDQTQAEEAIRRAMVDLEFGEAGETVVVEERLSGREFSLLTICGAGGYWSLPVAQDYKRAMDGDRGPNTGGMGSVSPTPWVTADLVAQAEERVVAPILRTMANRGLDYRGVLFSGLMVQDGAVYCLEYNVRFGDPETQSVLPRLGSGFFDLLRQVAEGGTPSVLSVLDVTAVTVVLASGGYPGAYRKGVPIRLPKVMPEGSLLFHAGTRMGPQGLETAGGRVFGATGLGPDLQTARTRAYQLAEAVDFEGKHFRRDIAAYAD